MSQNEKSPPRRLRLFLRDHRVMDANARVPQGQTLSTYLATRTKYVNLTEIDWVGTGERLAHISLKVDTVLWASSLNGDLPLTGAISSSVSQRVDLELEGGYLLDAGMLKGESQRLSDYLQSAPAFIPLRDAKLRPRDKALGDIVVNQQAIHFAREIQTAEDDAPMDDTADQSEAGVAGAADEQGEASETGASVG